MTSLSGLVTAHGDPALGAVVELHNATGDVVDQVQVDADGRYKYHLAAGRWRLKLWDPHGHRGSAEVTLEEGDDKTLDVTLSEGDG